MRGGFVCIGGGCMVGGGNVVESSAIFTKKKMKTKTNNRFFASLISFEVKKHRELSYLVCGFLRLNKSR